MATELDHDVIKQKIVAILQANTSLFTTTGEEGELRSIAVGEPTVKDAVPFAYVTNSSGPFEIIRTGSVVSNAITILTHTFHYDVVVVVHQKNSRRAEVELDEFQKLILQTIEADFDLTGGTTAEVDLCVPVRIEPLGMKFKDVSKGFKGRIITFRCVKTTA